MPDVVRIKHSLSQISYHALEMMFAPGNNIFPVVKEMENF